MVRGDLRDALVRVPDLVKNALRATLLQPFVNRPLELRLELALEIADAHVRKARQRPDVTHILVVTEDEILEVVVVADDVIEQTVELAYRVVAAKKDTKLLLLDLMEMDAVEPVVENLRKIPVERRDALTDN